MRALLRTMSKCDGTNSLKACNESSALQIGCLSRGVLAQSERRAPGRSIKLLITCVPRPPYYDGACERVCSRRRSTFIDRLLAYTCFVKENAPKILHCNAGKNFCALDNDENSTINTRAERFPAPRLSCFITRRNYTRSKVSSCSGALCQAVRRVHARFEWAVRLGGARSE